jgi:molecular chaperone HscB
VALRSLFNDGALVEFPEDLSHFEVLGIPESLKLDPDALRDQFYALSKQTHPDRFSGAEPVQALRAARWSTAVNRAYQTLRDPAARAEYLLFRHGLGEAQATRGVPMELAEAYFDLQDALTEPEGLAHLERFESDLRKQLEDLESAWPALEDQWEATSDKKKVLEQVAKHFTLRRFLRSMLADIERKRGGT